MEKPAIEIDASLLLPETKRAKTVHRVVILGGGFGGLAVVEGLCEESNKIPDNLAVTVLESKEYFSIGATWQFVWSNRLKEHYIRWPLSQLPMKEKNVDMRIGTAGTVTSFDTNKKQVSLQDGSILEYDTLVISAGVVSDASKIPGLEESGALNVCDINNVQRMRTRLDEIVEKAKQDPSLSQTVIMSVTRMPYKCPPVPFEVVSVIDDVLCKAGVRESITLILTVPVEFPFAGPPAKELFMGLLDKMNIEFWPNHEVTSVEKDAIHFKVNDKEKCVTVDALFCTFPQRAPDVIQKTGLCNDLGFIPVDLQTNQITSCKNAHAIGDACHVVFPKTNELHPKSGEFAYLMGKHVAKCILAKVNTGEVDPPPRQAACVAEVGRDGHGVNVQPNLSDILQNPQEGEAKFDMEVVEGASMRKAVWINKYLEKFFGPGNYTPFPTDA